MYLQCTGSVHHPLPPVMTAGVVGTGRRYWEWVLFLFSAAYNSTADTLLRRFTPSVPNKGPPHENKTRVGKQEVRRYTPRKPPSGVVNDDPKLGMRQEETKSIHPRGERCFDPRLVAPRILTYLYLASSLAETRRKLSRLVPFGHVFGPLLSFLSHQVHASLKSLCKKQQKNIT
jgi:hypothetical protein